jgi:hypothetical protein
MICFEMVQSDIPLAILILFESAAPSLRDIVLAQ